jgi:NAD(P)-dependent dehydrogenase (short-subunit alcohol dehydrogenase family)
MDDMYLSYETGVFATFRYMQACLPHLKKTAGTIVNYCSNSGMSSEPGSCAYGSNKEAIRGLSRTAGKEWGPFGITVNTIKPIVVEEHIGTKSDEFEALMARALSEVPLGRSGDPELDCGRLCVFLATKGKYLTGHTFSEDGGRVMYPG